jgi:DNA replication protein DnaC
MGIESKLGKIITRIQCVPDEEVGPLESSAGIQFYEESGIPDRHRDFRVKDNSNSVWKNVYELAKAQISTGSTVALIGNRGTGKTQMSACLCGYCAFKMGRPCLYIKSFEFFLRIRDAMKKGDSELDVIKKMLIPYLLVLDAYEVRGDTDFENRMMDHLIDKRYDNCKSTVIISNDNKKDFCSKVGASIVDRMKEGGGIFECGWESFRGKK